MNRKNSGLYTISKYLKKQQNNIFIKCMQKCYKLTFKQQTFLILKYINRTFS